MYGVPQASLTLPAVAGRLERGRHADCPTFLVAQTRLGTRAGQLGRTVSWHSALVCPQGWTASRGVADVRKDVTGVDVD